MFIEESVATLRDLQSVALLQSETLIPKCVFKAETKPGKKEMIFEIGMK